MPYLFALLVVVYFLGWLFDKIENFFIAVSPMFSLLFHNFFGILGAITILAGIGVFVFYKPHPAEKFFIQYKKGKITKELAISKIANTLYNPKKDPIPSVYASTIREKRLKGLHKLVKTEKQFIDDLIIYIKNKERLR